MKKKVLMILSIFFFIFSITFVKINAQDSKYSGSYKNVMKNENKLDLPSGTDGEGEKRIAGTMVKIINIIRGIVVLLAVIFFIYIAFQVISSNDEKGIESLKSAIIYIPIFIIIAMFVFEIPKLFLNVDVENMENTKAENLADGAIIKDKGTAEIAAGKFEGVFSTVLNFLYRLTATLAILYIVVAGLRIITAGGDSGDIDTQKASIKFVAIGLFIVLFSHPLVKYAFYRKDSADSFTLDSSRIIIEIMGLLNYCLVLVAAILLASTIYSGVMLVVEIGKPDLLDKAKTALINNLIGFMIIFCSYAIVATVISANSESKMYAGGIQAGLGNTEK